MSFVFRVLVSGDLGSNNKLFKLHFLFAQSTINFVSPNTCNSLFEQRKAKFILFLAFYYCMILESLCFAASSLRLLGWLYFERCFQVLNKSLLQVLLYKFSSLILKKIGGGVLVVTIMLYLVMVRYFVVSIPSLIVQVIEEPSMASGCCLDLSNQFSWPSF